MADPAIGEARTVGGETRQWDGTAWRLAAPAPTVVSPDEPSTFSAGAIKGLKDYAHELAQGTGTARGQVKDYATREGSGFLSAINPVNVVSGLVNTGLHPIDAVKGVGQLGSAVAAGQPEAVGSALGMATMPKLYAAGLRGVNSGATMLAESPAARSATGYVGGYLGAKAAGDMGFAGAVIGRALSPLLKYPAADVAKGSGWLMQKLGLNEAPATAGTEPPAPPSAPTAISAAQRADLLKQHYTPAMIEDFKRQLSQKPPTFGPVASPPINAAAGPARPPMTVADPAPDAAEAAWRARMQARINAAQAPSAPPLQGLPRLTGRKAPTLTDAIQNALDELLGTSAPAPTAISPIRAQELLQKLESTQVAPDAPTAVEASPASQTPTQPLGTPRVIAYKNYGDNLTKATDTPWAASSPWGPDPEDWHSGAEPGSAEAQRARMLHINDALDESRYRYLLDNKNASLLAALTGGAASRAALLKLMASHEQGPQ